MLLFIKGRSGKAFWSMTFVQRAEGWSSVDAHLKEGKLSEGGSMPGRLRDSKEASIVERKALRLGWGGRRSN